MISKGEIAILVRLNGACAYNSANKAAFQRLSLKLLRSLRDVLGIDADIRYNAGGIAVSGDATLHADKVYVSLNADGYYSTLGILYRACDGRKDYTGRRNRFYSFARLDATGVEGLAEAIRRNVLGGLPHSYDQEDRCVYCGIDVTDGPLNLCISRR